MGSLWGLDQTPGTKRAADLSSQHGQTVRKGSLHKGHFYFRWFADRMIQNIFRQRYPLRNESFGRMLAKRAQSRPCRPAIGRVGESWLRVYHIRVESIFPYDPVTTERAEKCAMRWLGEMISGLHVCGSGLLRLAVEVYRLQDADDADRHE